MLLQPLPLDRDTTRMRVLRAKADTRVFSMATERRVAGLAPSSRQGPRYVERGGELVARPPYQADDVRLYGFFLAADATRLSELYERMFSEPSDGKERYVPAGPWVLVVVADIRRLASAASDHWLGHVSEREIAIWAPALDESRRRRPVWTVPYMFVDSGRALADGRETYGYPKQLGHITIDGPEARPHTIHLSTEGFTVFARDAAASPQRVLSICRPQRPENGSGRPSALSSGVPDLLQSVRRRLRGLTAAGALLQQMTTSRVPMVLLKQFRSCADSRLACYQAIVEVGHVPVTVRAGGLLPDDYTLELHDLESEPIERELGISSGSQRPHLAFWLDFDFLVENGTVLWRSPHVE